MSKKKESLLWQFRKNNESRTHYILGTMHVKSEDAYTPVSVAKHYMELCHTYVGEMDLNDPELSKIGDYFLNQDGLVLEDLIGEKKYKKYSKIILKAFDIDIDEIAHYKPLVISNMIAESITTKNYDVSLDHFLWEYAQAIGMEMKGLESANDQFEIMKSIPMESQLKGLKSCVKNVSSFRSKVLKMSELYAEGELTELYKSAKKSMGELRKLMIYDRNARMTERLVEITSNGATFAAVGAAHLGGTKGMLRGLKKAGFIINPIKIK
ncbi:MAG: hypothetical protein ACI86M_002786 [Saprospiraceae bacterium]|jgi:uncharacterized protein YbaP (TraB family)